MQIHRLFGIVYILLQKRNVSARELSEYFEVSPRTIYRDIETLCQAGIPVYTQKGRGGGIRLSERFILDKSVLSPDEQNEILSALHGLQAVRAAGKESVLSRLHAFFGDNNVNWVEIDFSDWNEQQADIFANLKQAILSRSIIAFSYYNALGERRKRTAEPIQLWFKNHGWYLKAFCRDKQDFRLFKISRIQTLTLFDERFEPRETKEWRPSLSLAEASPLIQLRLTIDESQGFRVFDEFLDRDDEISQDEQGDFLISAQRPAGKWLYRYLISYGADLKWIEPEELREEMKHYLESMMENYSI